LRRIKRSPESKNHFNVVETTKRRLFHIEGRIESVAYEPVWAIGTGKCFQSKRKKCENRETVRTAFGVAAAPKYGGSKPIMQKKFFKPDVDGGLIGGAA
jgi:triosephosphate isomerase